MNYSVIVSGVAVCYAKGKFYDNKFAMFLFFILIFVCKCYTVFFLSEIDAGIRRHSVLFCVKLAWLK